MSMKKKIYEAPLFEVKRVELEKGFMKASIFLPDEGHDKGLTIEEHGFANTTPGVEWEGDYTQGKNAGWDN